jgi:hypothetical protein
VGFWFVRVRFLSWGGGFSAPDVASRSLCACHRFASCTGPPPLSVSPSRVPPSFQESLIRGGVLEAGSFLSPVPAVSCPGVSHVPPCGSGVRFFAVLSASPPAFSLVPSFCSPSWSLWALVVTRPRLLELGSGLLYITYYSTAYTASGVPHGCR